MPSRTEAVLLHIRDNIAFARQIVGDRSASDFEHDRIAFYAATRCLEIISEACRRLPDDLTARHPAIDWRSIRAAGNIYRHEYEGVEQRIVWTTVRSFLGDLDAAVQAELARLESPPAPYTNAQIAALAEGLLDRSLPKAQWTHAAHLAATMRLVRTRDEGLERDLPGIIQTYNVAVGGVNDDAGGYHETITQAYLAAIRAFVATLPPGISDSAAVARLLASPMGDKAWPLSFWSRERLFSVAARRGWIAPDLQPLD